MNYQYVLQRLLLALIVVLGVTFVVFLIMQIVPGDPARVVLGPYANDESVRGLRERLGLDRPFFEQYFSWLGGVVQGDFGQSLLNGQGVAPQLRGRIGPSFELAMVSLAIGLAIAFPIGIVLRPEAWQRHRHRGNNVQSDWCFCANVLDGHFARYHFFH